MKKQLLFLVVLLFAVTSTWASITPVYVNGSIGNDTWDGSSATWVSGTIGPKATIQAGINAVSISGTVYVAAGTYNEAVVVNKPVTLLGAQANVTPITGGRPGGESIINGGSGNNSISIEADNVVVNGFEVADEYFSITTNNFGAGGLGGLHQNVQISYNYVHSSVANNAGIVVGFNSPASQTFTNYTVSYNLVSVSGSNALTAISLSGGTSVTYNNTSISHNDISNSHRWGIFSGAPTATSQFNNTAITYNNIHDMGSGGINLANLITSDISHNVFTNTGYDAAFVNMSGGTFTYNTISSMQVSGGWGLELWGNTDYGILSTCVSNNVEIANNSFTYDDVNTETVGLWANPSTNSASLNVHDNTFIDGGFTSLASSYAVVNKGGSALDISTAGNNSFNGVTLDGSTTLSNLYTIANRVLDNVDVSTFGYINLRAGNVYVTPNSFDNVYGSTTAPSIQRGIDAASLGWTVNVEAGTYTEQVSVGKNLTVTGAGSSTTTIQAPAVLTNDPDGAKTIVLFTGAITAEFSGFTVQGPVNGLNFGIYVRAGATVNIHDNVIKDIRDEPLSGNQYGYGIEIGKYNNTFPYVNQIGTATITNNTIYGYQKTGIECEGTGSSATITGNTVTGAGLISTTAQNGIQIRRGATGSINTNTVTGNAYTGHEVNASGIGVTYPGINVIVQGNIVNHNTANIYTYEAHGIQILNNQVTDASDGRIVAGITADADNVATALVGIAVTITGNSVKNNLSGGSHLGPGIFLWGVNSGTVSGNDIVGSGDDGILIGGSGNISFTNNLISGNGLLVADPNSAGIDFGGIVPELENYGLWPNPLGGFAVHENSFVGNRNGIWNYDAGNVNATCNWWDNGLNAVSGNVTWIPYLSNGIDNSPHTGFQPVPGSCSSSPSAFYVNDNSQAGDVFTGAIGNDANTGTAATPFRTIQHAINVATGGETIHVDAGIYPEHLIINKTNLTLIGANNATTIIDATQDPSWTVAKAGILIRGTGESIPGASGVTISGFTIRNAELQTGGAPYGGAEYGVGPGGMAGVQIYGSSGNIITGNIFENCGYQVWVLAEWAAAGYSNSQNNMITNNIIGNSVGHGIYLYSEGTVSVNNTTITGNEISDAHGNYAGIRFLGDGTSPITNTTIENNSITGCSRGIRISFADVSGISIHNNSIYSNVVYGLQNQLLSYTVNASLNWWGDPTGPFNATTNPCALGNAVSDNVTYAPWYTNAGMTTSTSAVLTYKISGTIKYANNANTPLNGILLTLKKTSDNSTVGTYNTNSTPGSYQFTGLTNNSYYIELSSTFTGGAWQTWGGVNATDYLLVLRHAMSITLLPTVPAVIRVAANVINPTGTGILTNDANAIRLAYTYHNPTLYFNIPKWVFSEPTSVPYSFPYNAVTGIIINCANVTTNILGLCAGDVNASYLPPSGPKSPSMPNLELINRGTIAVANEITLPVKADMDMELGAITLILDYDASQFEITGVTMPKQGNEAPYFTMENNVLEIGWASLEPVSLVKGETILAIHGRVKNANPGMIRFTLNSNPLSELANGEGIVFNDARLAIADIGGTVSNDMISVYPNPANDILNIEYVMDAAGPFRAELCNVQGAIVGTIDNTGKPAGTFKEKLGLSNLPSGVYFLRVFRGDNINTQKIIINR